MNIEEFRDLVFRGIKKSLEEDGVHKSYEGIIEVGKRFPGYFDSEKEPTYILTLHCYVFGPARHYDWEGNSLKECLAKAEKDVKAWTHED